MHVEIRTKCPFHAATIFVVYTLKQLNNACFKSSAHFCCNKIRILIRKLHNFKTETGIVMSISPGRPPQHNYMHRTTLPNDGSSYVTNLRYTHNIIMHHRQSILTASEFLAQIQAARWNTYTMLMYTLFFGPCIPPSVMVLNTLIICV